MYRARDEIRENYIRTKPSNVFIIDFPTGGEISDNTLHHCVPGLSNRCEIVPDDEGSVWRESVKIPKIYNSEQEIINGEPVGRPLRECFWECLLGAPVAPIAEAGTAAVLSGSIPKKWVGIPKGLKDSNPFTSIPSIIAHKAPGLDNRIRKLSGDLLIGNSPVMDWKRWPPRVYIRYTDKPLRFIGRWIPGVGWGLLAADILVLDQCIAQCRGEKSFLQFLAEELLPIPKPAY